MRPRARGGKDAEAWSGGVDFIKETEPFELADLRSQALLNEVRRRAWLRLMKAFCHQIQA